MRNCLLFITLGFFATTAAYAGNSITQLSAIGSQDNFKLLSEDLAAACSYKAVTPAANLGVTGFDIGIEATDTKLAHPELWQQVTGSSNTNLIIPKVHIHKGLPAGLDVGAFYSSVPRSNIHLMGAEIRYALVKGDITTPAVGLRGTYTRLSNVDQLALHTTGLELTVSKGFAIVTPYAGAGVIHTMSNPHVTGLTQETFNQGKYYLGANLNFGLANVAFEGDRTGNTTSYSAKIGFRF